MTNYFDALENELTTIGTLSSTDGVNGFFGQEVLRFHSIAGSLLKSINLTKSAGIDERYISHILARSLLENFFWLIYLFDDASKKEERYERLINSFKRDYYKLMNEPLLMNKNQLEPAEQVWSSIKNRLDVNSMLAQITNDHGERLNYLYFIYRIASFDTHGKNLSNIFQTTFGKAGNFPLLDLNYAFDLIANEYLVILQDLRDKKEI